MDPAEPLRPLYTELLARFASSDDEIDREIVLGEVTELSKLALAEEPLIDPLQRLHHRAQAAVAERWRAAAPGSAEHQWRERLVRGDALPVLLAAMLPHELALRAQQQQRWRREHETLLAMFEQTEEMIVVLDTDGQCDDVNPAFCRLTGWSRRDAVEGAAAWSDTPLHTAAQCRRAEQLRSDGSRFMVEWSVSPIFGHTGALVSFVCMGRDVDRQQKIDDSLRENDKLRAVATLAGGIAHDFNNLLGSILGLTELCQLEAAAGTRQERNLGRIQEAGNKAAALVRQMLDFSRQTAPTLQRVRMAEWLAKAETLLRAALPRHQTLALSLLADATVSMDTVQMEQVLLNVLRNASQALGCNGGVVRMVVDLAEPGRPQGDGSALGHVRLQVIDDGEGIAPELLHKIFEPFFTTKPVGEGTGLGLAAVHGIVSSHGGVVEVTSAPGVGTTLSIYLPMVANEQAMADTAAPLRRRQPAQRVQIAE